jgi:hypothetical protein
MSPLGTIPDFDFLPHQLLGQCRQLVESHHKIRGYGCLPNLLWKAGLGPFIEQEEELSQLLKKASRTRSAREANNAFVVIATTILALEILASNFLGWSATYPEAGGAAIDVLKRNSLGPRMQLIEVYVHTVNYTNSGAIAILAPR